MSQDPTLTEEPQNVGVRVALDKLDDSLVYFSDGCRFVYEWCRPWGRLPAPREFRVALDEGPIPYAAVRLLREFKALLTPDLLRTIGIAGAVYLDRLLEVHAFGGYDHDKADTVTLIPDDPQ